MNKVTDFFDKNIKDTTKVKGDIDNIKNDSVNSLKSGKSELEIDRAKINELSNISSGELESKGRGSEGMNEFTKSGLLINKNEPGMLDHKNYAENLGKASEDLMNNLIGKLKEHGIDCYEIPAQRHIDPQFKIYMEQEIEKKVIYDKFFCEHLRNSYSCSDYIELNCASVSEQKASVTVNSTDLRYSDQSGEKFKRFIFESNFGGTNNSSWGGGKVHGFINKNTATMHNASEANYYVNFSLATDPRVINRLEIRDLSYGMCVMVKLNGKVVFVGPMGGNDLYLNGHIEIETKGKKKYAGAFGERKKIKTYYPRVVAGNGGEHALGHSGIPRSSFAYSIDLKGAAQMGPNRLEIKVISLYSSIIRFGLEISEKICLEWVESWNERCDINLTQP